MVKEWRVRVKTVHTACDGSFRKCAPLGEMGSRTRKRGERPGFSVISEMKESRVFLNADAY